MFVRAASPAYYAPASFNLLDADGQLVVCKFDCLFKRLKHSELLGLRRDVDKWSAEAMKDLQARAQALAGTDASPAQSAPAEPQADADTNAQEKNISRRVLGRVMAGWRGVQAADGSALPYSPEALDETEEEFPGFINACTAAFWESCAPKAAAHLAAKN
jgi:hypothetical protein